VTTRLEQLKRWQKSLNFQAESINRTNKLKRLGKEEELLFAVSTILETESNRFIQKNYMNLDIDTLNIEEKIQIVNDTILTGLGTARVSGARHTYRGKDEPPPMTKTTKLNHARGKNLLDENLFLSP